MSNPIGVNILLSHVKDHPRMHARLNTLKPAFVVATVDGDSDMKQVHSLNAALPNETLVFGRVYVSNDGAFHQKPQDGRHWLASPDDCLNRWGELGRDGRILYLLNEPGTHTDDATVARLVDWSCEVIEVAALRSIRVCIDNFGVEHPPVINGEWDSRFDPLLRTLAKHPDAILGLHEYLPMKGSDRVGRFKALVKACKRMGIPVPRMAITEAGYDTIDGSKENGYKSRGISGDTYAKTLIDVWQREYASTPQIMGLAVYCYGDNGGWSAFDIEGDTGFWDTLLSWNPPPPIPAPPVVIPPVADPIPPRVYTPALAYLKNGAAMVNLRSEKSTAPGTDIGDILAADRIKYAPLEGGWWPVIHIAPDGRETAGFASDLYFEPTPMPVPPPKPEPPAPPTYELVFTLPKGTTPEMADALGKMFASAKVRLVQPGELKKAS